jgi:transcriptional regulator with XRE-family HTH domain
MEPTEGKQAPTLVDVMARNLRATRERRRLTVRGLSQRLTELGRPILHSGISKMENGDRGIDVAQLVALAAALNTSPAFLLTPADDETVLVVPAHLATGARVGDWVRGESPLVYGTAEGPSAGDVEEFMAAAPPSVRARYRAGSHPAVAALESLSTAVRAAVGDTAQVAPGSIPASVAEELRRELARVAAYVDLLAGDLERVTATQPTAWNVDAPGERGSTGERRRPVLRPARVYLDPGTDWLDSPSSPAEEPAGGKDK